MMNVEARETVPEAVARGAAAIEIRLSRPQQLFNSLDPSPFHERDLDDDAENYLVDSADEYPAEDTLDRDHPPAGGPAAGRVGP